MLNSRDRSQALFDAAELVRDEIRYQSGCIAQHKSPLRYGETPIDRLLLIEKILRNLALAGEPVSLSSETADSESLGLPDAFKCRICGAGVLAEHAASHIENHRASGWDGTETKE